MWVSWKPRIQLSQVESSLCTSPQDKVDKELDGQQEIGFSFGWNFVYINICIQSLPHANSCVYIFGNGIVSAQLLPQQRGMTQGP